MEVNWELNPQSWCNQVVDDYLEVHILILLIKFHTFYFKLYYFYFYFCVFLMHTQIRTNK